MKVAIVIPAREGSTRFPNKPLALVAGKSVLHRTYEIAVKAQNTLSPEVDTSVFVTTDSLAIKAHAEEKGAKVLMSGKKPLNGTERVFEALGATYNQFDRILNLQGDAILTPPSLLADLIQYSFQQYTEGPIWTPYLKLNLKQFEEFTNSKLNGRVSGTLVVFNKKNEALYFSKGTIPFCRYSNISKNFYCRHIGVYLYTPESLRHYCQLPESLLEKVEGLEQLRALENGMRIEMVQTTFDGRTPWSIDNPEDIAFAEKLLLEEGEF